MSDFYSEQHLTHTHPDTSRSREVALPETGFTLFPKSDKTEFVYGMDRNGRAILPYSILTGETEQGEFVVDSGLSYENVAALKNVRVVTEEELPFFRRMLEVQTRAAIEAPLMNGQDQTAVTTFHVDDPLVARALKNSDTFVVGKGVLLLGPRAGFDLEADETNPYPIRYIPIGEVVQISSTVFVTTMIENGVVRLEFHTSRMNMDPNATQQDSELSERLVSVIEHKRYFPEINIVDKFSTSEDFKVVEDRITEKDLRGLRKTDAQIKRDLLESLHEGEATSDEVEELLAEYERWKKIPQMIRDADTVFFPRAGGLGDAYYQILMAMSIARANPKTNFYIHRTPVETSLYPESFPDIPNLQISFQSTNALKYLHEQRKLGQKVAIINLDRSHDLSEGLLEESQEVEKELSLQENGEVQTPRRQWYKQMLRRVFAKDEKGKTISYIGNSSSTLRNKLLFRWAYSVTKSQQPLNLELAEHAAHDALIRHTRLSQLSGHQLVDIASKLENLFKVSSAHLLKDCPLQLTQKVAQGKETQTLKSYDVVLVYDAKSKGLDKLMGSNQWQALIAELKKKHPGISIGIVKGLTNPETLYEVFAEHPDIDLISGELGQVVRTCANAKTVVTVDTGIGHFVNAYVKHERQKGSTTQLPKIISFMGTSALFSIPFYRLDEAQTIIVKNYVRRLKPKVIIQHVEAALAEFRNS